MSLDQDLRSALRRHADDAPAGTELLAGVRRRSSRLTARRRAVATTIAAFAAVALAATPTLVFRTDGTPDMSPGIELVRPSNVVPPFPLTPTPTSLPGWVGVRSFTFAAYGQSTVAELIYEATFPGPRDLSVIVSSARQDVDLGDDLETSHTATVGGQNAIVRVQEHGTAVRSIGITWQLTTGAWAQVRALGPVNEAEVRQVADGLTAQDMPMAAPFRFELLPRDATLVSMNPAMMRLATGAGLLTVSVDPAIEIPGDTAVTVNGDPAAARTAGGGTELFVRLSGDRTLHVTADDGTGLGYIDLIVLAEGIALEPAAVVSQPAR